MAVVSKHTVNIKNIMEDKNLKLVVVSSIFIKRKLILKNNLTGKSLSIKKNKHWAIQMKQDSEFFNKRLYD